MSAVNIDLKNFGQEIMNSDKPVLLDFWAPWCGPCRMVVPIVEEIARERADIKVGKVNIDEQFELARQFGVLLEEEGQALRATFLLNPAGEVVLYEIHDLGIGRSAAELLRKVRAARFVAEHGDQVCPAAWQPGEETLTPSLDLVGLL